MKKKILTITLITIFSILLWVFVSLSDVYFTSFTVPIVFKNIPKGYAIGQVSEKIISLSLKGQGWQLAPLSFGRKHKFAVPVEKKAGEQTVLVRNLYGANTWLTSNLQVIETTPHIIKFRLEKIRSKKVQVVIENKINIQNGYGIVSKIKIIPKVITISGARSIIKKINFVKTEPITFLNVENKVSREVPIQAIDGVSFNPKKCLIKFDVERIVEKTFENVTVKVKYTPSTRKILLLPPSITIILRGGMNQLSKMTNKDLQAYITYKQALRDTLGTIVPHITIPPFTELLDVKPERLNYVIQKF